MSYPSRIPVRCDSCGLVVMRQPCEVRRNKDRGTRFSFCSNVCKQTHTGFNAFAAARNGDVQRGKGEGRTYRKRGGRHEHRAVAEQKLGRSLRKNEIVHHVDGDYLNNSPDNLQIITQSEHIRLHLPVMLAARREKHGY